MKLPGFIISKIVVRGPGKADAQLSFRPGLNVIAGASNTGKTYAWQVVDFMFGASRSPKSIPHSSGYSEAMIELRPCSGGALTLVRALEGGGAKAYAVAIDEMRRDTPYASLAEKHDGDSPESISGRLLELAGLWGKVIRKNAQGEKRSLSFRDVAWLSLVDEERIIVERSPVLSGMPHNSTEEKSVFGLFIRGVDDAAVTFQEDSKSRKKRLAIEMVLLQRLLGKHESRLTTFALDPGQLPSLRATLAKRIEEASAVRAARQSELDEASEKRDLVWSDLQTVDSRRLFLGEQVKRLDLLRRYYRSDEARLESALEAGGVIERLPQGECPVCGHKPDSGEYGQATNERLKEFQDACSGELAKIAALSRDLEKTLSEMRAEDARHAERQSLLRSGLAQANARISDLLDPKVRAVDEAMSQLLAEQSRLSEAGFIVDELSDLRRRLTDAEEESKRRMKRRKFVRKVDAASATKFCKIVEATLRAWRFPFSGDVSWSEEDSDVVIGGEKRGSMGKGYRAVTHAAFTVALMRYCRAEKLPHPGIVVLDTPLNPFKGPDRKTTEGLNMEVQEAFYADLAKDESGDQVVVFENTEPPVSVRSMMEYKHFSGNPASPPAGFFPI